MDKPSQVYDAFCDCLIKGLKQQEVSTDLLKVAQAFIHRQNISALPVPGGKLDQVGKSMSKTDYEAKF